MDESKKGLIKKALEAVNEQDEERTPKRLVEVEFEGYRKYVYFSDIERIAVGDCVRVNGKLEESVGVVQNVRSSFKKPDFEMKWVEEILDNDVSGEYFTLDQDLVSTNCRLTVKKFMTLSGVVYKENEAVFDNETEIDLETFTKSELFTEAVKLRGEQIFEDEEVLFISLQDGIGKAIVYGSKLYEIDFRCKNGKITNMACDCPCFDECKHEYALLLKLRAFCKKFYKTHQEQNFVVCNKDFLGTIVDKGKGEIKICL